MFSYCACRCSAPGVTGADGYGLSDALSGAFFLSAMNYFLLGWNLPVCHHEYVSRACSDTMPFWQIDGYYEHSFEIWLACTVVFPGAGNLGFTMLEYRLGSRPLLDAVTENLTWIPFLSVLSRRSWPKRFLTRLAFTASSSSEA